MKTVIRTNPRDPLQPVGLVGLDLTGCGIASCLLAQGLEVAAYNHAASRTQASVAQIDVALRELARRAIVPLRRLRGWRRRLHLVTSIAELAPCPFVIEALPENLPLKRRLYDELEDHVPAGTVIASNTSSFPIALLQDGRKHPARFIVMHWGEPAQIMRYLEVIPGRRASPRTLRLVRRLGEICGKEPTVLREDIRGFLSNRMMYAMIREALHLVEAGVADVETVDRSFRNDIGWWALLAGPFRWMDLTGIPAYQVVMEGLLPKLCNDKKVSRVMRDTVARGAQGIANAKGFYPYTKASAKRWEKNWIDFTYDVRKLADKYARRGG